MRGITVRQPYATAIVRETFAKDVENRTRDFTGGYRGALAIHAGLAVVQGRGRGRRVDFPMIGEVERDLSGLLLRSERLAWPYRLPLGAVIGVVDLVDAHEATPPEVEWCGCSPWAERFYVHHLVLANPRPLARPIPWRGALGLWRVPDELEAAIREQVTL